MPTLQKVNVTIAQVTPKAYSLQTGWLLYVSLAFVDCMLPGSTILSVFLKHSCILYS